MLFHNYDLRSILQQTVEVVDPVLSRHSFDLTIPALTCFQLILSWNTPPKTDPPFLFSLRAVSLFPSGHQWQLVMILFKYSYAYLFSIPLTRI